MKASAVFFPRAVGWAREKILIISALPRIAPACDASFDGLSEIAPLASSFSTSAIVPHQEQIDLPHSSMRLVRHRDARLSIKACWQPLTCRQAEGD
jgi:hypothetical protein